jgi:hypothetical protein
MRDQVALLSPTRGVTRRFLLFFTALLVSVFGVIFTLTPTANAADGTWKDGTISYEGNTYTRYGNGIPNQTADIPKGAQVYTYSSSSDKSATPPKVNIIWFAANEDPAKAKTAHYGYYTQTGDATFDGPSKQATVTFSGDAASAGEAGKNAETTSCIVEGIGWIVCPLSNFLSDAMDKLFAILQSFLTVQPIGTDTDGAIYRGWAIMRNFANIAFIGAFLFIIYSQVTSIGISTYGIKRLLPRVIIAAILVNLSYWICAIAVDLSNISGHGVYDIMEGIRQELVKGTAAAGPTSWKAVTGAILAGGAAAGAAGVGVAVTLASAGGSLMLLLPILLGVVLAVLVAIMVLAARQAIIVVAIMIAPLAFVAYLLPNTEKFFTKWRELLSTLLLMFPLFAGVMGGAQLAGEAIINSAIQMGDGVAKLNLIIFGMAVKVAPVVVTPFLLKFSGSLLGRVAGIVNNPGKGLVDRTRNWSQERADDWKAKQLASKNPNFLARQAQRIDTNKRRRQGWRKANEARADANWHKSDAYRQIHGYDSNSDLIKQAAENRANQHVAEMRATDATTQGLDINARASKLALDVSQARVDANWEEIKAGEGSNIVVPASLATSALISQYRDRITNDNLQGAVSHNIEEMRKTAAQNMQANAISDAYLANETLQHQAGGIDPQGDQRALAAALKKRHDIRGDAVKTASSIIDHSNLKDKDIVDITTTSTYGQEVHGIKVTEEIREAALAKISSSKNVAAIQDMLDSIDVNTLTENQRITLSERLKENSSKPKYIGASASAGIAQGDTQLGQSGVTQLIIDAINNNKYSSAEVLAGQEDVALKRVAEVVKTRKGSMDSNVLLELRKQAHKALTSERYDGRLGERKEHIESILAELGGPPPPTP